MFWKYLNLDKNLDLLKNPSDKHKKSENDNEYSPYLHQLESDSDSSEFFQFELSPNACKSDRKMTLAARI